MSLQKQFTSPLAKQIWVVSAILLMMMGNGMIMGVTNCMLLALQAPDSPIQVSVEAGSWLSSSVGISSMLTYFVSSTLMSSYGRRIATLIGLVPALISPLICYFATDFKTLVIGRFLSGVRLGSVVGSVVTAEYTSPQYRGIFLNLKVWMIIIGITIVHALGNYLHWRTVMLTVIIPYGLNFLMAFTWPESPSWLATQKRYDEAVESFHWLKGKSEQANKELYTMIEAQKELNSDTNKTLPKKTASILMKFRKKNFLKPVLISIFLTMLLETSGRHIFPAYVIQIVQQMDTNKSNAFFYTMCIDLIVNFSAFASIVLIKLFKRRTLLFSSGVASIAVLFAVSLYQYLENKSLISSDWNVLSFLLFGSYFVFINIGCTPVTFTLMGELYPLEHRSIGSAMTGILMAIFMFVTLKITPMMLVTLKVYGTFTVYGVSMAVCLIILYFTIPETKDKTMQEIEDHFNDERKDDLANQCLNKSEDMDTKVMLLS